MFETVHMFFIFHISPNIFIDVHHVEMAKKNMGPEASATEDPDTPLSDSSANVHSCCFLQEK